MHFVTRGLKRSHRAGVHSDFSPARESIRIQAPSALQAPQEKAAEAHANASRSTPRGFSNEMVDHPPTSRKTSHRDCTHLRAHRVPHHCTVPATCNTTCR